MTDKYSSSNEMSLERIYRKRHLKTLYVNDMTPDDIIEKMNELKSLAIQEGYENLKIGFDVPEYGDEDLKYSLSIASYGYSLETDEEYRTRLSIHLKIIEKGKRTWEERMQFYNGTGEGSFSNLVKKYNDAINNIK